MGTALLRGIVANGVCAAADIRLSDPAPAAVRQAADALPGATPCPDNVSAAQGADTVLICVKPAEVTAVIAGLAALPDSRLLISIAAGVTLADMEAVAGHHRVVRVMPNTPTVIGRGASAYTCGRLATPEDSRTVERLLGAAGLVTPVGEPLLDAVTGLSGSGPAYVFSFIEALADGGVAEGLTRVQALRLAAQTVAGAADLILQSGEHPAVLRDQVTSPGGTTIAGLAAMEARAFRSAVIEAVRAAAARSRELGRRS